MSHSAANHFVHIPDASCPDTRSAEPKLDDMFPDTHSAEHNPVPSAVPKTGSAEPDSKVVPIAVLDAHSTERKADIVPGAGSAEPGPEMVHNKPNVCSAEHNPGA
ncbi:uncharacterized protein LAESUDRAFT_753893 [Laetiporus sulphureus 93-53]|uniref:Uncharacterized protein n=1 Tax=Laetiporus sulphureus 93-53 TaxID=1314785 RepID=A0A165IBK9_9APHY|nr:uncharacterized protein LAESUDRAFT_753893 [Laetiporus sulphureus 93-53]KZT12853.1 hypothetical protein LAESUDRAFT_753893 [Laetiporus sulphureus 93-53]